MLTLHLDMKRAIYVVDDQFVANKIEKLMGIQGEIGFIIKVGLFSGLREEEIIYSHGKEICPDNAGHKCDKLHVINKPNGMSIITLNWFRGNKQCYFFIMPTNIWKQFRNLSRFTRKEEINSAHNIVKREVGLKFIVMILIMIGNFGDTSSAGTTFSYSYYSFFLFYSFPLTPFFGRIA